MPQELQNSSFRTSTKDLACWIKAYPTKDPNLHQRIELSMSTTYHPQTDGTTKQSNQKIEAYLAIFRANNPEQWSRLIPIMEFSYNQKSHATQIKSLFYLIMGSDPKAISTAFPSTNIPETKEWIRNLQKARDEAIAAHELARQKMMEQTTHKFKASSAAATNISKPNMFSTGAVSATIWPQDIESWIVQNSQEEDQC